MTGSDQNRSLLLYMAEDYYQGDAQFLVFVDGLQVGGVQTATASHSAGAWQAVTVTGNFSSDPSQVSISFLNDAWGGSAALDRNLYVSSLDLNGASYQGSSADNHAGGFSSGTAAALDITGAITFHPRGTLTLNVSEDSYHGDAQFLVYVDGRQVGGIQTATASHSAGAWQAVTLSGDFGSNPGQVSVAFLNDAWGGSLAADRNLYVNSLSLNGITHQGSSADNHAGGFSSGTAAALNTNGSIIFSLQPPPSAPHLGVNAVSFAPYQYISAGDAFHHDGAQSWSAASEIKLTALPPGPSGALPGGGAELVFGNTNGAPYSGYEMWIDYHGDARVRIMSSFLDNKYIDVAGATDLADGKTHLLSATYDGSSKAAGVSLYVDGNLEHMQVLSDTLAGPAVSTGPMIIGNQLNGWQNQFELGGQMANISLSDVARPQSYFQSASAGFLAIDGHTQLAYDFTDGSGLSTRDLSGHGHDGTLSSAAMWDHIV